MNRRGTPGLSLAEFAFAAWPILEPVTPLNWNWHLDALALHTQAVLMGGDAPRNLVINIPPGTAKSLMVSVFAPAWKWLWEPSWKSLFVSANPRVALRDSVRCRDLIESKWYKETFDVRWALAEDQNAKGNYKNTAGGSRLATSVNAKVTGDRVHGIFIDDPLDASESNSKPVRDSVNFWYDQALGNRVADPVHGTRILIAQRLHVEDLPGHVLESGDWAHLNLPMLYEPASAKKTWTGWTDPRTVENEPLHPSRFPPFILASERKRLGSAGWNGQMQQRPVASKGNRFQREWWRFHSLTGEVLPRPKGASTVPPRVFNVALNSWEEILGSWDCAFKDQAENDWVVGLTVAREGADFYVLDRFRNHVGFARTQDAIRKQRADWPQCFETLIEDKANGTAIIETLSSTITGIIAVEPHGGKEARAAAIEPTVEAGNVFLPEGADWLEDWIEEFAAFPLGRHDDQVDALSQVIIRTLLDGSEIANARALLGQ